MALTTKVGAPNARLVGEELTRLLVVKSLELNNGRRRRKPPLKPLFISPDDDAHLRPFFLTWMTSWGPCHLSLDKVKINILFLVFRINFPEFSQIRIMKVGRTFQRYPKGKKHLGVFLFLNIGRWLGPLVSGSILEQQFCLQLSFFFNLSLLLLLTRCLIRRPQPKSILP